MTEFEDEKRLNRQDPDGLLSSFSDPGAEAMGAMGTEAGSDLNWFMMLRERVQEHAAKSSKYSWWVLWSLLAGLFALNFTFTVFIVALPSVATEFHTSISVLSWTMIGPLLAYGLAAPLFGKTGDIFGHRRLYLFGLIGAMASAILTALSHNVDMLLLARTLDGIQGAATGTASGALINRVFRPDERVKALGWWSLIGAGGPVIGVSLGSPIIAAFGWRALFWFQLFLIAAALCVVTFVLPKQRGDAPETQAQKAKARKEFKQTDWLGSWSLSFSITALMLGLSLGPIKGWTAPLTLTGFVIATILMAFFIYRLNHAPHPLIPAKYFKRKNFAFPIVIRACCNFAYFGAFFLFPLLMEQGYGYSVPQVGGLSIARPITFAICSPIAGYVAIKIGERRSVLGGAFFLTLSLTMFSFLQPTTGAWVVAIALALSGLGMGTAMPSSSAVMANEVKQSEFGVMSAAQMLAVQVGEVAGIEVLETVQQGLVHSRHLNSASPGPSLLATFHLPFLIGAIVGGFGLIAALFISDVPRDKPNLK